ncbi:membrane protein [Adhaeribacter aerolatus]|uniref:Membrane protein n=1 Tax=Adhaeribacter aerolatus TaxID=670289 RepID=A0A512AUL9_9BACT|nr:DUF1206 domain-containing protein [Adhaeribacter aerolatus]GEO03277.1 membrane protein [Adhaeribacter aerolatus]
MEISIHNTHLPHPRPQWTENFARFGMAAKGVVYSLVGALAFMAAFEINGNSEQGAGKQGVFQFILEQPFGKILLGIVTLGLVCYTIWRFIQAFMDSESKGADAKGIGKRIGYAFSGVIYGSLAFYAAKLVLGSGSSSGGGDSRQTLAGKLLEQPFGQWLVGIVAIVTMGMGLYQIYKAISGKYLKNVQTASIKSEIKDMLMKAGKVGYIARGIVWGIIGFLFLKAAMNSNAQEAGGTSSAFQFLEQSYGSILLGAIAIGLVCYGVFMFVRARYEVINT